MKQNQTHPIEGTIYAINTRTVQGRKDPTETFTFVSVVLEVDTGYPIKPKSLPEFHIRRRNLSVEGFAVGDKVEITFALVGGAVPGTKPWHKTEAVLLAIRHLDINYNDTKEINYSYKKEKPVVEQQASFFPPESDDEEAPF